MLRSRVIYKIYGDTKHQAACPSLLSDLVLGPTRKSVETKKLKDTQHLAGYPITYCFIISSMIWG